MGGDLGLVHAGGVHERPAGAPGIGGQRGDGPRGVAERRGAPAEAVQPGVYRGSHVVVLGGRCQGCRSSAGRAGAGDGGQAGSEQLLGVVELPPGAAGGLRPVVVVRGLRGCPVRPGRPRRSSPGSTLAAGPRRAGAGDVHGEAPQQPLAPRGPAAGRAPLRLRAASAIADRRGEEVHARAERPDDPLLQRPGAHAQQRPGRGQQVRRQRRAQVVRPGARRRPVGPLLVPAQAGQPRRRPAARRRTPRAPRRSAWAPPARRAASAPGAPARGPAAATRAPAGLPRPGPAG